MIVLAGSMVLGVSARTQHGARERRLEQAKAEERVQLARELHDTVAHHVSAIAIRAQAGRALAATDSGAPVEALEVIETEASQTLAEMRAMVRVLRNREPADYAPQAGVADLGRLAGGYADRAAGRGDDLGRPEPRCRRRWMRPCSGSLARRSRTRCAMRATRPASTYASRGTVRRCC